MAATRRSDTRRPRPRREGSCRHRLVEGPVTGDLARAEPSESGIDELAAGTRARTARMERAAPRERGEAWHRAIDLNQPIALHPHRRDRAHESGRVRVTRTMDHRVDVADLHDA